MNITVVGGGGVMGAEVSRQLVDKTDSNITVVDYDETSLSEINDELGPEIRTQQVDIYQDELSELVEGTDLVVNSVGPYYRHGTHVLDVCIEEGVNYIDICDDYDTTKKLLEKNETAKSEGITAIIGMGASPGLTNLIAKCGYNQLNSVDSVKIYWAESAVDPTGFAAIDHWLHITWGNVPMYIDGSDVDKAGLSDPEPVTFPEPLGELDTVYTGHPEPVTLPQSLPDINTVIIKGTIFPPSMMEIYDSINKLGGGSPDSFKLMNDTELPFRELSIRMIRASPHFSQGYFEQLQEETQEEYNDCAAGFKIVVEGVNNNTDIELSYDILSNSVKRITAVPAALCSRLFKNGSLEEPGVFPPEAAIDPDSFLSMISDEINVEIEETWRGESVRQM